MDVNRDESERCINIAEEHLSSGNVEKALKFLNKAQRLYPTQRAQDLISKLTRSNSSSTRSNTNSNYSHTEHYNSKFTSNSSSPHTPHRSQSDPSFEEPKSQYTADQKASVDRVLNCSKDYYAVLGLSKDSATEIEIKKSYRRLALQFHPDKNAAPGATEAFKVIGKAFAVLSDSEKRARYDQFGPEEDQISTSRRSRRGYQYQEYEYYENDFDAEEIFNMFFGGAFPQGNVRSFHRSHGPNRTSSFHFSRGDGSGSGTSHHHQSAASFGTFLQLMPLILLLMMSLLSTLLVSDPPYSLHRSSKHVIERRTGNLNVVYYVKEDFVKEYTGQIHRVEQQVEDDYIHNLRMQCVRERNYRENALWRARVYSDARLWEEAHKLQTPSCDRLNKLYA